VRGPPGVAEFAEDLPEPVVDLLEDSRAIGELHVVKPAESGDGSVDPGIPGAVDPGVSGWVDPRVSGWIERFWVHCSLLLGLQLTSAGSAMRYSPA
jgi:hypothetical protein